MVTFDAFHQAIQDAGAYCWSYRNGRRHVARCPAHADHYPSMEYEAGTAAGVVAYCFSQDCTYEEMVRILNPNGAVPVLYTDDPPPRRSSNGSGPGAWPESEVVACYVYRDAAGEPIHQTLRYEPKEFRQQHWDGTSWRWGLGGRDPILYRLPELLAAPLGREILFVEGEKDVDNLVAAGFLATTTAMGAKNWARTDLSPLYGRRVTVIADQDDVGRQCARAKAAALVGRAASVRLVEVLPDA